MHKKHLSKRQKKHIGSKDLSMRTHASALVVSREKQRVWVMHQSGNHTQITALKVRRDLPKIVVGDCVLFSEESGEFVVEGLVPRTQALYLGHRLVAANMDALCVLQSRSPTMPWKDVEALLFWAHQQGLMPVLIFNKSDLLSEEAAQRTKRMLESFAPSKVQTLLISAKNHAMLPDFLKGKKTLMLGPSGVGKSTLVSALVGESIETKTLNKEGYGQHVTSVPRAYLWDDGAWLVDLPGIRHVPLFHEDAPSLEAFFGFDAIDAIEACRFRNCLHLHEEGCAVRAYYEAHPEAALRYRNYQSLIQDVELRRKKIKYSHQNEDRKLRTKD